MSLRISGGRHRGRVLQVPEGQAIRPTAARVREAAFDILLHGRPATVRPLRGARVLDAYAGTGALGLEALSRGASRAAFVDDGAISRAILRKNIEKMQAMGVTDVWRRDATKLGPNRGPGFNLIFLDPPYGKSLGEAALASAVEGGWLAPEALVVWEEGNAPLPPGGFELLDQRRYGESWITLLRLESRA